MYIKSRIFIPLILIIFLLSGCSSVRDKLKIVAPKKETSDFYVSWSKNLDPEYESGNLPIGLQSPNVHEGLVFVGDNKGLMKALDLKSGRSLWEKRDRGAYHSYPRVFEGALIYGTTEGFVYSRNYLTGDLNYVVAVGKSVETPPVYYKGRVFFQLRDHRIVCLDAKTGGILWAYKRSVPFTTTIQRASTPAIFDNKLFVGLADGTIMALSVEEGVVLWERKVARGSKFIDVDMSPTFFDSKLFVGGVDAPLFVLNPSTGEQLFSFNELRLSRSPLEWKGNLLVGTLTGELVLIGPDLSIIKRQKVSPLGISGVSLWKDQIVVTTLGETITLLDPTTFKENSRFYLGHSSSAVFGKPIVSENMLVILSSRNRLYVFK
jgi:outer membrane protein assembly factor BamB